jgi:hypothetical protein
VTAAVAAGLGLNKAQPKKKTTNAREMPEDQRATPLQTGPLSLGLSTVAVTMLVWDLYGPERDRCIRIRVS